MVGYSFGAGVLPFLVNRLPERWRSRLSAVSYLAYPGVASFEFKAAGWLLHHDVAALPSNEEVARLPRVPSLCIAGESDPIRDCSSIEPYGVERRLVNLGHGLHPELPRIVEMVVEKLDQGNRQALVTLRVAEPINERCPQTSH